MTFSAEQNAALNAKLDSAKVVQPNGKFGPKGPYIEGWHAIAEANRIFGFDGWGYTIIALKSEACELGKDGKGNDQWQAAYTCQIEVRAGGVIRQDVGFGSGFAKQIGDAIEGATKEAVTDALKRALRTFGNPFGLALYDKQKTNVEDVAAVEQSKARSRTVYEALQLAADSAGTADDLRTWCSAPDTKAARKSLPADWQEQLTQRIADRGRALMDKEAA